MSTNIDGAGGVSSAWPARASQEVGELRRAITAQLDEPMIASSAAPMLGELLARLEGFSTPRDVGELRAPEPPSGEAPMTHSEAAAALHDACGALREQVLTGGIDRQRQGTLQGMVEVIENHLTMKGEILAKNASDATPG